MPGYIKWPRGLQFRDNEAIRLAANATGGISRLIQIRALNLQVAALTDERDALEAQVESDRGTGRAQE